MACRSQGQCQAQQNTVRFPQRCPVWLLHFFIFNVCGYELSYILELSGVKGFFSPFAVAFQGLSCSRCWPTEWLLEMIKVIINTSGLYQNRQYYATGRTVTYSVYVLTLVLVLLTSLLCQRCVNMNLVPCFRNHLLFTPANDLKRQNRSSLEFISYMPFLR